MHDLCLWSLTIMDDTNDGNDNNDEENKIINVYFPVFLYDFF